VFGASIATGSSIPIGVRSVGRDRVVDTYRHSERRSRPVWIPLGTPVTTIATPGTHRPRRIVALGRSLDGRSGSGDIGDGSAGSLGFFFPRSSPRRSSASAVAAEGSLFAALTPGIAGEPPPYFFGAALPASAFSAAMRSRTTA